MRYINLRRQCTKARHQQKALPQIISSNDAINELTSRRHTIVMYRTLVDQNQKFSLISQCAFSYMALVLVVFCKVDEKAYWFSRAKMIHTNQYKIKSHCFFSFSVQIFDFTNSKTRPIYETLIKKMVDTLRLSTLHKSMKRKINQVYFTVQPSDSVSHLALFEFLDFVTLPFMLGFFSFTIFNRA